jgi:hypothetical protein
MLILPFDPIQRAHEVEQIVMQGDMRRYYRFRSGRVTMRLAPRGSRSRCSQASRPAAKRIEILVGIGPLDVEAANY